MFLQIQVSGTTRYTRYLPDELDIQPDTWAILLFFHRHQSDQGNVSHEESTGDIEDRD
jgi:hypothetical protein